MVDIGRTLSAASVRWYRASIGGPANDILMFRSTLQGVSHGRAGLRFSTCRICSVPDFAGSVTLVLSSTRDMIRKSGTNTLASAIAWPGEPSVGQMGGPCESGVHARWSSRISWHARNNIIAIPNITFGQQKRMISKMYRSLCSQTIRTAVGKLAGSSQNTSFSNRANKSGGRIVGRDGTRTAEPTSCSLGAPSRASNSIAA